MIMLGGQKIAAMYAGAQKIAKAYAGENKLFGEDAVPSRLPEGYTEVEYIETDGYSYILIPKIYFTNTCLHRVIADMEPMDDVANYQASGSYNSYKYYGSFFYYSCNFDETYSYYSVWLCKDIIASWYGSTTNLIANLYKKVFDSAELQRYKIDYDIANLKCTINNIETALSSIKFSYSKTVGLAIGRSYSSATSKKCVPMRIYSAQLYLGDTQEYNLIPCKAPSGAVGMYDLITNSFLANANTTGSLIPGPAV